MILFGGLFAGAVLLALLLDAVFGEPEWLWRRMPHPVVVFGKAISFFEKRLNHPQDQTALNGRLSGSVSLVILLLLGAGLVRCFRSERWRLAAWDTSSLL